MRTSDATSGAPSFLRRRRFCSLSGEAFRAASAPSVKLLLEPLLPRISKSPALCLQRRHGDRIDTFSTTSHAPPATQTTRPPRPRTAWRDSMPGSGSGTPAIPFADSAAEAEAVLPPQSLGRAPVRTPPCCGAAATSKNGSRMRGDRPATVRRVT